MGLTRASAARAKAKEETSQKGRVHKGKTER